MRNTDTQKRHEKAFQECLVDLFDEAHAQALNKITNEEDKKFLLAQQEKGRRGCMAELDVTAARKLKNNKLCKTKKQSGVEKQRKKLAS